MSKEPIHSGHFMTSNPHLELQIEDEDEDVEVDVVDVDDNTISQINDKRNVQNRDEKPVTFYKFGPQKTQSIAIDVSLNKLNKCIKVAYMKMTTPKWKDFKGLKLQWKYRIRLNNVIWRAYYMEFRKPDKKKKTQICYFAVPDDDTTHSKLEGSVLEGMYWKRRMEAVCAQYKRWRTYNRYAKKKPRNCCRKRENSCGCDRNISMLPQSQTPQNLSTINDFFDMDDDFGNEFTNELFESLNAPFLFPNPKESAQSGNADIMQPGLLSLQPSIEEIMSVDSCFTDNHTFDSSFDNFLDRLQNYSDSPTPSRPRSTPQNQHPSQQRHQQQLQQQSYSSNTQQQQSQNSTPLYTAKEYDTANVLLHYSNQPSVTGGNNNTNVSTPSQIEQIKLQQRQQAHHLLHPQSQVMNIGPPLYSQAFYGSDLSRIDSPSYHLLPPNCSNILNENISFSGQIQSQIRRKSGIESVSSRSNQESVNSCFLTSQLSNNNGVLKVMPSLDYMPQILAAAGVSTSVVLPENKRILNNQNTLSFSTANTVVSNSSQDRQQTLASTQQNPWWFNSSQQQTQMQEQIPRQVFLVSTRNIDGVVETEPNFSMANFSNSNSVDSQRFANIILNRTPTSNFGTSFGNSSMITAANETDSSQKMSSRRENALTERKKQNNQSLLRLSEENLLPTTSATALQDLSRYLPELYSNQSVPSTCVSLSNFISPATCAQFTSNNILSATLCASPQMTLNSLENVLYQPQPSRTIISNNSNNSLQPSQNLQNSHKRGLLTTSSSGPSTNPLNMQQLIGNSQKQFSQKLPQQLLPPQVLSSAQSLNLVPAKKSPSMMYSSRNLYITSQAGPTPMSTQNLMYSFNDLTSTSSFTKNSFLNHTENNSNTLSALSPTSTLSSIVSPASTISSASLQPISNLQTQNKTWNNNPLISPSGGSSLMMLMNNSSKGGQSGSPPLNNLLLPAAFSENRGPLTNNLFSLRSSQQRLIPNSLKTPQTSQQGDLGSSISSSQQNTNLSTQHQQPLQYAEMTNVSSDLRSRKNSCRSSPSLNSITANRNYEHNMNFLSSGLIPTSTSASSNASASSCRGRIPPSSRSAQNITSATGNGQFMTARSQDMARPLSTSSIPTSQVKEEQVEKTTLVPAGSKRRHLSAGSASSSNSAPADSTLHPEERKRILHLHAEKNRRSALKEGFDMLVEAIPAVEQAGVKSTNAVVLNRAAQYLRELKSRNLQRAKEVDDLRSKIAQLNEKISLIQSNLPSSSRNENTNANAPSMRSQILQFYERYRKNKSKQDYRFWLMSEIFQPIVQSYSQSINQNVMASRDELLASAREWLNRSWNSAVLRPIASETLVRVATAGGAFGDDDDEALPKYIMNEISKIS